MSAENSEKIIDVARVTDYVANGSFAALKANVNYKKEKDYAVLVRLVDHKSDWSGPFVYVDENAYTFLSKSSLKVGDVIISNVGAYAGTVFRAPDLNVPMTLGPNSIVLKDLDCPSYWYYYFSSQIGQHQLDSIKSGSAQPKFNKTDFRSLLVPKMQLKTKVSIASVLGTLDDKIENNRRMNETLEEMAREIFKSWFVDFDPVHAKAEGKQPAHMDAETAALFDSSFGDDGLPVGWSWTTLSDVCSVLGGYAFKSKEFVSEGMPVVKIKNITGSGDVSLEDARCVLPQSVNGKDQFKLEDGDLLIAMTGATVGKTGILTDGELTPYLNQRVGKFIPNENIYKWAVWAHMQFQKNVDAVISTGTGSAQTNISASGIVSVKWVVAPSQLYKKYNDIVSPYFDLWVSNKHQNKTLVKMRDTLLPKLMTGEIRVKDAEREVEAVA